MKEKQEFCSLKNVMKYIELMKETGNTNHKIIKKLANKGCAYSIIFDAMDKTLKET